MTGPSAKLLAFWMSGLAAAGAMPALAGDMAAPVPIGRTAPGADPLLPGTSAQRGLLEAIAAWLSSGFALPPMQDPPALAFAGGRRMAGLRLRDDLQNRGAAGESGIIALYDDEARTIYLPKAWTGATPEELSILVHEMVHHLQNSAGAGFECPEAREKMAYEAQARWLAMFGSDLSAGFGIDPLTLLVRTSCFR